MLRPLKKASTPFYYVKMQVSGNNGFPDCYYSGPLSELWAEYKYVTERDFPKRDTTDIKINLSANQRSWLKGRHEEGRNVCVIIGSPYGALFLRWPVPESISRADFIHFAVDDHEIASYIARETTTTTTK